MKIAILVAGGSDYFPLFFAKPKTLYHRNGIIHLEKVLETVKKVFEEKDIIVVVGYKCYLIKEFLRKYPMVIVRENINYRGPAINSLKVAIKDLDEDVVFLHGDEDISEKNIRRISESNAPMSILYHNQPYYYSLGIFKLSKSQLGLIYDDKYLDMEYLKEIYCFANSQNVYDGRFNINSGICIGYMTIDFIRRIGQIKKVEDPSIYSGRNIDFILYDPKLEYVTDLDCYEDTDEYQKDYIMRVYYILVSKPLRCMARIWRKIYAEFNKYNCSSL